MTIRRREVPEVETKLTRLLQPTLKAMMQQTENHPVRFTTIL